MGAFSHMTKTRPEIVIEAQDGDGEWREFQFRCKLGDVTRAPCVVAPLAWPLDWSLWFVPLGGAKRVNAHPWFFVLVNKLACGEPDVLALLGEGGAPFNTTTGPPRAIRARIFEYEFAQSDDNIGGGGRAWWTRTELSTAVRALAPAQLADVVAQNGLPGCSRPTFYRIGGGGGADDEKKDEL